jgi:hypothetical protein
LTWSGGLLGTSFLMHSRSQRANSDPHSSKSTLS